MIRTEEEFHRQAVERLYQENSNIVLLNDTKHLAAWVSWFPWVILPFFLPNLMLEKFFMLAGIPLGLALLGLFTGLEILLFLLAFTIGYFLKNRSK